GWSEQRPQDWWDGVVEVVRRAVDWAGADAARIAAICVCGQMHGTVLVDGSGNPSREAAPLWNDKRTSEHVSAFEAANPPDSYLAKTANPATPAWPGFKLQWIRDNDPAAYDGAAAVLMPKDFVNLRLTGEIATDWTEASLSFLMDRESRGWSAEMVRKLDLDAAKLPPIRSPHDVLGAVSEAAARITGLSAGTPVLVGGGDFPVALLGSGVCREGLGSDVTGTSSIITFVTGGPIVGPEICNVATPEGNWGAFVLLESGGDAMRWARRALHQNRISYDEFVRSAAEAPAGSDGLVFLPYLVGERLGPHRNSRAQFFGLSAGHGAAHLDRAVMEGVAFAVTRQMRGMEAASGVRLDRVVASGGGAKTELWLAIKASAYGRPILVPEEAECSVVGCSALAACATGRFSTPADAATAFVRYDREIAPDPAWAERYQRMQPVFDRLYLGSQAYYDDLDALAG
ncbi:MAG TPA: FGGY family carbohydrate kinase, partial [Propylenella sp.]|nr:FGGY family carbohydrate kinase [Propylenella sp.]